MTRSVVVGATRGSRPRFVNGSLRSHVVNAQEFLAAVEEGKQALRDGRTVDHDTVAAAFERIANLQSRT